MATAKVVPTEQQVHDAIRVILSDTAKFNTSLNYAVNYCRVALGQSGEELRVQCLYILNNISGWRHERAKEVRETLKAFSKSKPERVPSGWDHV